MYLCQYNGRLPICSTYEFLDISQVGGSKQRPEMSQGLAALTLVNMSEILYQMSMQLPGEGIASGCVHVEHQLLLLMVQ